MSRPQKIIKPVKGSFTDIVTAIADGYGVKGRRKPPAQSPKPKPPKP